MSGAVREIDQKIVAMLDQEIASLEADLSSLRSKRALFNGHGSRTNVVIPGKSSVEQTNFFTRADSGFALAMKVLRENGKPMHVEEIVKAVLAKGKNISSRNLKTGIYRAARKPKLFKREGPGIFGLLEWHK